MTLNKNPAFPFSKISLGPVGQFDDIINFFKTWASNNTLGSPSYNEVKIKISDDLIKLKGFVWYGTIFTFSASHFHLYN